MQWKKKNKKLGIKISAKMKYNQGWACKKYRNKEQMKKHKKTVLLQKSRGKEKLEDYSTSVAQHV